MKSKREKASLANGSHSALGKPQSGFFKNRQSLRTSFRLSPSGHNALKWLAKKERISAKELVDSATQMLLERKPNAHFFARAKERDKSGEGLEGERRTLVVTNGALERLKHISDKHGISRDSLLDTLLQDLYDVCKPFTSGVVDSLQKTLCHWKEVAQALERAEQKSDELIGYLQLGIGLDLPGLIHDEYVLPLEEELGRWKKLAAQVENESETKGFINRRLNLFDELADL